MNSSFLASDFARGMVRPAVLAVLILLVLFVCVLAARPRLYAATNTITVTTTDDPGTSSECSLREAILNANAKGTVAGSTCEAGTGTDTIVFNLSGKISLASALALPSVLNALTIDGSGQTIDVDGSSASSIFVNSSTGMLTLNNLTISTANTPGNGGGVSNDGMLVVTNCTFSGNTAAEGGAIFNSSTGTMSVSNSTFSGNSSVSGAAIHSDNGGTVLSSTFSTNSAGSIGGTGAAILANGGMITVTNSILASSTGTNCAPMNGGSIVNGGGNISDDSSCGFGSSVAANGDMIGDNVMPLLDSLGLQNNGGPTDTIALQATSPALNAIPIANNCPPTDQRGDQRPDPGDNSGACDIGAFESNLMPATPTPTATATSSVSPTATATSVTATATATDTATLSATPTTSATSTATDTPTITATMTSTATATATATATSTNTATASGTPTNTATATNTATSTGTPTATITATPTPTVTPTATVTATATPTSTQTPKPPPIKLTISPKSVSFGKVMVGDGPTKVVTLHNKSQRTDMVSNVAVRGQFFSIADNGNGCAGGVPAAGSCQITVSFVPSAGSKKLKGKLTFTDQSKNSQHSVTLDGKGVSPPTSTPTKTPKPSTTPTATPTATSTMGSTGTPTITPTATATNSGSPTATPTPAVSETGSGFVVLHNRSLATASVVATTQATAASTPSYTGGTSLTESGLGMAGAASWSQSSSANGTSFSVDATANMSSDISECVSASQPCDEQNQGITDFTADFCIGNTTTYNLSGSAMASPSVVNGTTTQISGVGTVMISTFPAMSPVLIIQATNGQNVPISMPVMLPAGCYEFMVEAFADTNGAVSASGSASATCNVTLSP